ncbi:MAG: hypothetical protein AMXMBFR33_59430 [Candidatus Xenobia bacterium]
MKVLPDQRYDCLQCGRSCQGWAVEVDPGTRGRLRDSPIELRVLQETGLTATLLPGDGRKVLMARREGACVYLDEKNLCRIHGEMGPGAKPLGCRQFPFLPVETPEGVSLGLSFYCTAVQQNYGRPLEEQSDELSALLQRLAPRRVGFEPLWLDEGVPLEWPEYLRLEAFLLEGLSGPDPAETPLAASLWGACQPGLQLDLARAALFDTAQELWDIRFMCLAILVASQEAPDPDSITAMAEDLKHDRPVTFARLGWSGRRSTIDAEFADLPEWVEQEIRRYLRALVFRKFLALDRPVLQNLVCLFMLPALLRCFTLVSRLSHGGELVREDYFRALSLVEKDLTHTRQGAEGTWASFARLYRETIALVARYV